jgi:hypothetical protein
MSHVAGLHAGEPGPEAGERRPLLRAGHDAARPGTSFILSSFKGTISRDRIRKEKWHGWTSL